MPRISVLTAHHGAATFFREASASLGAQDYRDFEWIVVDDASGVDLEPLVRLSGCPSLRLLANAECRGLTASLNRGLRACNGELVARMDSDDLLSPDRFSRQVAHLDAHPEVGILGTAVEHIDPAGRLLGRSFPLTEPADLHLALPIYNQLCHGSILMRAAVLDRLGGYDEERLSAQDYDLWLRARDLGIGIANLPTPHYRLRLHEGSVSRRHSADQEASSKAAKSRHGRISREEIDRFFAAGRHRGIGRPYERLQLGKLALYASVASLRAGGPSLLATKALPFLLRRSPGLLATLRQEGAWRGPTWRKIRLLLSS